jgi:hypothetical protein
MEQVTDLQDVLVGNPIFVRLVVLLSRCGETVSK